MVAAVALTSQETSFQKAAEKEVTWSSKMRQHITESIEMWVVQTETS